MRAVDGPQGRDKPFSSRLGTTAACWQLFQCKWEDAGSALLGRLRRTRSAPWRLRAAQQPSDDPTQVGFQISKKIFLLWFLELCQFLTQKVDPWFSLLSLTQSDQSRCPRLSGFFGGFLDYAGCDEWLLRAFGAADGDARDRFILPGGLVRRQKRVEQEEEQRCFGASGDGGATATAAVVGTPPESFGARRVGGESMIRVCAAEDLAEVFDPSGLIGGWTLGEVERVVKALPEL